MEKKLTLLLVIVLGCGCIDIGTSEPEKVYGPMRYEDLEIFGAYYEDASYLRREYCYSEQTNTYTSNYKLRFGLNLPPDYEDLPSSKAQFACDLYVDGEKKGKVYTSDWFYPGEHEIGSLAQFIDVKKDHTLELCCEGVWDPSRGSREGKEGHVCKSAVLEKLC